MSIPCPIPYHGSKRRLAGSILTFIPENISGTFFEPFAGSASISLAYAKAGKSRNFVLSDILAPLTEIWKMIINEPEALSRQYQKLWLEQLDDPRSTYFRIRAEYNESKDPVKLLYLIVRCVKNSIRFNPQGYFNQSPDNRRKGMHPSKMHKEIFEAHGLLSGKTTVLALDYRQVLSLVTPDDFVYMDPPYQGVSNGKDKKYFCPLSLDDFIDDIRRLNRINVPFIISFDGNTGTRTYGDDLPTDLGLKKISLVAGRSSQATLLGRDEITVESLYLSPTLMDKLSDNNSETLALIPHSQQLALLP